MQEQNSRLIQQLREKDDANFKLMSERIKSNQIARLAREEKEMYIQQVATLTTQVEAQNQSGHRRERAPAEATGHGDAQEESDRVGTVGR